MNRIPTLNFYTSLWFCHFFIGVCNTTYFFFLNLKLLICNLQLISLIGQLVNWIIG